MKKAAAKGSSQGTSRKPKATDDSPSDETTDDVDVKNVAEAADAIEPTPGTTEKSGDQSAAADDADQARAAQQTESVAEAIEPAKAVDAAPEDTPKETSRIDEPAKVTRLGILARRLLEETREPLDDPALTRLADTFAYAKAEISSGLSADLADEFNQFTPEIDPDQTTDADIRVALAQLVGWLEGLYGGLQPMSFAQPPMGNPPQPRATVSGGAPSAIVMAPGKPAGQGQSDESHTPPGQYL